MPFYRRRLPHLYRGDQPVFLTWRLHGSLPANRHFPPDSLNSGAAFVAMDRLLDRCTIGPQYLSCPRIADTVVESLHHHAEVFGRYSLHAFAVMPNHVHMLVSPKVPVFEITKKLKSFTAKQANEWLGRTGNSFWQDECYDRLVRDPSEFERIRRYIEDNPVHAGLVAEAREYRWSSAGWPAKE